MEEHEAPLNDEAAARSAQALEQLHAHAMAAASLRRERLRELESQLTRQLNEIAATIALERVADDELAADHDRRQAEVDALRQNLNDQAADLDAQRAAQAEKEKQLAARSAELEAQSEELARAQQDFAARQSASEKVVAECDLRRRELDQKAQALSALEQDLAERSAAVERKRQATEAECERNNAAAQELASREAAVAKRQTELEHKSREVAQAAAAAESARAAAERAASNRESLNQSQFAALAQEHDELRELLQATQQAKQALEGRLASAEQNCVDLGKSIEQERALQAERETVRTNLISELEQERDGLKLELAATLQSAQEGKQYAAAAAERDELKQKFELAVEDVQRLRIRVAALEQELSERPAAGEADSAELVSLRAERDALAERVESLENAAPAQPVGDQQLADLQRRFELAVEDVRELKTKNAQLESQLAAARRPSPTGGDVGGMDWESQKRRLLASLEGSDEGDAAAQEERATITSTIQITDAVVADKDQEIAELKAQLAAFAAPPSPNEERQKEIDELLDTDEVIQKHRQQIAQYEQELEAKLRAAELELSVERAKIARQKVELEQLRLDLESAKQALGAGGAPAGEGAPKRRWLSKLGLGNESNE